MGCNIYYVNLDHQTTSFLVLAAASLCRRLPGLTVIFMYLKMYANSWVVFYPSLTYVCYQDWYAILTQPKMWTVIDYVSIMWKCNTTITYLNTLQSIQLLADLVG